MFECCGYRTNLQLAESPIFSSSQLIPAREKEKKSLFMSTRLLSIDFPYLIFLSIFTAIRRNFLVIMFECCGHETKLQLVESPSFSSFQLIPAREGKKSLLMSTRLRSIYFPYIIFLFIFTAIRRKFFSDYV